MKQISTLAAVAAAFALTLAAPVKADDDLALIRVQAGLPAVFANGIADVHLVAVYDDDDDDDDDRGWRRSHRGTHWDRDHRRDDDDDDDDDDDNGGWRGRDDDDD